MAESSRYTIPSHIVEAVRGMGYALPYIHMRSHIEQWANLLESKGDFWDYTERESSTVYKVHRRTIRPAQFVCEEWASLILNDKTDAVCEDSGATEWLASYLDRVAFWANGQDAVADAFGLGTSAIAVWIDEENGVVRPRHYDATMVLPLSWDDDAITECAFCTKACVDGVEIDQLQLHVCEDDGYHIKTRLFDSESGEEVFSDSVEQDLATGCPTPTFGVLRPAIPNRCVKFSPYGQSVVCGNADVIQSVDLCFDAVMKEVDLSKMRVLMADSLFEVERKDGKLNYIPFGKADTTAFRRVGGSEDFIHEWAPSMRTEQQRSAFRMALQMLGQKCGLGKKYLDIDESGGLKTATEVSSENSALMRNIRKHENAMQKPLADVCKALVFCNRAFAGEEIPEAGDVRITWDDSIITDTAAEKASDLAEVGLTMQAWEYRVKWYGEDEETAKANAPASDAPQVELFE